jgi:hypothetical protein
MEASLTRAALTTYSGPNVGPISGRGNPDRFRAIALIQFKAVVI